MEVCTTSQEDQEKVYISYVISGVLTFFLPSFGRQRGFQTLWCPQLARYRHNKDDTGTDDGRHLNGNISGFAKRYSSMMGLFALNIP